MIYLNRSSDILAFSSKRLFCKTRFFPDARMAFLLQVRFARKTGRQMKIDGILD